MNSTELFNILALLKVDGVGDIVAKKLINHCGSAENVFNAKANKLKAIDGIGTTLIEKLKDKTIFDKATEELKFIETEKRECDSEQQQDCTFHLACGDRRDRLRFRHFRITL